MTEQHPITPSPELVDKWLKEPENGSPGLTTLHTFSKPRLTQMLTRAAQWGSDQELEACCEWLDIRSHGYPPWPDELRAARRPKPPSLKQQALEVLESAMGTDYPNILTVLNIDQYALIRRALEALPDEELGQ